MAPAPPSPWTTATAGFYYVDEAASGATDTSNPYGTPAKPRRTIPTSLPAGAVVEVHGTYTKEHASPSDISAAGTSAQPVYIRGASPSARPTITRSWQVSGSYLVMENLAFAFAAGREGLYLVAPINHAVLRASEVRGNAAGGGMGVISWDTSSASNIVIYGNTIHDNGDVNATNDQDVHGIVVGDRVSNLWIVDNQISYNSGDGIQISGSRAGTHHIYVGRNVSHHNKQIGMGTKNAADVIFSENTTYGHRRGNSSDGGGIGILYEPDRVWMLFNRSYDNENGIWHGSGATTRSGFYYIGNVLHDNLNAGMQLNSWVEGEYAIGNTFYNNPIGLENGYYKVGLEISDNIFSTSSTAHISFREYGSGAASNLRNSLFDAPVRIVWDDVTRDVAGMQSIGECGGCRSGDPLFANAAGADLNLRAGSPAIDGGVLEAVYATFQQRYALDIRRDASGRVRPQGAAWEIGAFEFTSGTTPQVLTVALAGAGSGAVTSFPAGINCGTDCSEAYNPGTVVSLTATPATGSSFGGWSGACSGGGSCQVTMSSAKLVTATFNRTPTSFALTLSRGGDGGGTVTSTPVGINCGADCTESYAAGTVVTLTPTPANGSVFASWSGACTGNGPCQVTMDASKTVTASFALAMYSLTVTTNGSGTVTSSPAGISCGDDCMEPYNRGTLVTLSAIAGSDTSFSGWTGACAGTGTCRVTIDAAKSVAASFVSGKPHPAGDFDRDGRPDLLWRHRRSGSLYVWFLVDGKMKSGAYLQPDRADARTLQVCGIADLDRDTHTDLLWQDAKTGALVAWLMNGTKRVRSVPIPSISLPTPSTSSSGQAQSAIWQVRGLADLNRDGHNDVIWHHPVGGDLYVWFMNGTTPTSGASLTPGRSGDTNWQLRGIADVNDGFADLLWRHGTTGELYVWFMNGTTAISTGYTSPARVMDTGWQLVQVSDFNNDGHADLLWYHPATGQLYVSYMSKTTVISSSYLTPRRATDRAWGIALR